MAALASASEEPAQTILEVAEIRFTNAFNAQRPTLAKFATTSSLTELHVIRDTFLLNMGSDLCPKEAGAVKTHIVQKFTQAAAGGNMGSFQHTIMYAVHSPGWGLLMEALKNKAEFVNADLQAMWLPLETGRIEWLRAINAAHVIKTNLRDALREHEGKEGDVSDGLMVYMYCLALSIPALQLEAAAWASAVGMNDTGQPLLGYKPALWDPRRVEWKPLDLGVQGAAERGGSAVQDAWNA